MRVGLVIERIETWRGGAETSTLEYAHLLAQRGVEVSILTSSRCPSPPDLRVVPIAVGATPRPLRTVRFIRKATAVARRERLDLVHAITPMPRADLYQPRGGLMRETLARNLALRPAGAARLLKRVAAALNVKHRALLRLEEAALQPDGPMIAAVSAYVARQLATHYGIDGPRVRVVFNGVNVAPASAEQRRAERGAIRAEYGVRDDELLLLCVAHNFRLKGVAPLLHAVANVVAAGGPGVRLLVAGRDNPAGMVALAQRLAVADRVMFAGPTQRIAAFYHAADVCVHPTYYDPCSRVVLEALSRGVPCITTRHNGAAEAMRDGVHGYVIDSADDVEALAGRIRALRDTEQRREMGRAALALAPRLSMTRHVDEMLAVYDACAARRPAGARA
ncbi:MAG: glycosyltransferase family 4 protein [Phycisphaerae bacterium]